jgi:hypothetical protein
MVDSLIFFQNLDSDKFVALVALALVAQCVKGLLPQ